MAIRRISVDSAGNQGNSDSFYNAGISADGRYVTFSSHASNLVADDPNGTITDVFVRDLLTGTTTLLTSGGNGASWPSAISSDGRYVTFQSAASNLVAVDPNGSTSDIFLRDLQTGVTTLLVSGSSGSDDAPVMSSDGRYVAFQSPSSQIASDINGTHDVYVRDVVAGTTILVSAGGDGASFNPSISGDGRYVAFYGWATNLADGDTGGFLDVFVRDLVAGTTTLVTAGGNGHSQLATISANGRYVVFESEASNLVAGDSNGNKDIFLRDLVTGTTTLLTPGGDGGSYAPAISANGRFVVFESRATNLVVGDTNATFDVFVHDVVTGATALITPGGNGYSGARPTISANGRYVTFWSEASNLVAGDTNGASDVFVADNPLWVNAAPTGAPTTALATGTEDIAYTVTAADLLAGFSDADGDTLSISGLAASTGALVDNGSGTYTITQGVGFYGQVTLTYNVIDGNGGSVAAALAYDVADVAQRFLTYENGTTIRLGTWGGLQDWMQEYRADGTLQYYTDWDQAGVHTWSRSVNYYNSAGTALTQKLTAYDDGTSSRQGYDAQGRIDWLQEFRADGTLQYYTDWDQALDQTWSQTVNYYNAAGTALTQKLTTYDNGTSSRQGYDAQGRVDWLQEFDNLGRLVFYTDWDQADANPVLARYVNYYTPGSSEPYARHFFNDDGSDYWL